jgi:hypothetical protein
MGSPTTCEYADPSGTGDVEQKTSTGLAFWRKFTNTPTFTDGWNHWALTDGGVVTWTGSGIDPPGVASPSSSTPVAAPLPPAAPVAVLAQPAPVAPPPTGEPAFAVCAVADAPRNQALVISGPGAFNTCVGAKTYLQANTFREWTVIDNTSGNKYAGAFNSAAPQIETQCVLGRGALRVEVDFASNASPWSAEWCTTSGPLNGLLP